MINPNIPFNLRCRSAISTSCMSRQLTFLFFISLGLERSDPIRPLFSFFLFTSGKVGLKPSGLDEPFLSLSCSSFFLLFSFLFFQVLSCFGPNWALPSLPLLFFFFLFLSLGLVGLFFLFLLSFSFFVFPFLPVEPG